MPTARAGVAQTVIPGVTVTLDGNASSDPDGTISTYNWTQTAGAPTATLTNGTSASPSFTAPAVSVATTFTFSLTVTDNSSNTSPASTVDVVVNPAPAATVLVQGNVTFARVPFGNVGANIGLDYANTVQRPARGIAIQLINTGNASIVGNAVTDSAGNYWMSVPANTNLRAIAFARMQRDNTNPLPRWDVRVQNGVSGTGTHQFADPVVVVNSGTTNTAVLNVAIPSGHNGTGGLLGARTATSGPFAILDTIYQGQQRILSVAPTTNFPALIVDWGVQNVGSFFSTQTNQHIALLSDLTEDTDEYDQHVIAHEFGHYIEFNFSRADNIGGAHGLGNRLDVRVAFGEGFGYAFAGIVLNDPVARDSYGQGGSRNSTSFDIERNPGGSLPLPGDATGCWCSESSVWSLIWDFYDTNADTNDTVAMGFLPIWNVLTGAQRTTPAVTSIFSFATALKAAQTGQATAVNTLLSAQNIVAGTMDAFGATETNVPTGVATSAALPVFTSGNVGGAAVIVSSANDAAVSNDSYNKLGSHRFVRFSLTAARNTTITVTSTGPDPDFVLYRQGEVVLVAEGIAAGTESATQNLTAGDYVIDAYECANGCDTDQGTEGDFTLNVTIN